MSAWLMNGSVQKLVIVVKSVETGESLERWVFDCDCSGVKENRYCLLKKKKLKLIL